MMREEGNPRHTPQKIAQDRSRHSLNLHGDGIR
jgi:hypothetical protein